MKSLFQKIELINMNGKKTFYFSLLFVLCFKIINTAFFIYEHKKLDSDVVFKGGMFKHNDYGYYLKPVDNFFEKGILSYNGCDPFAGRMPGYWFPYLLLRSVFSQQMALGVLFLMQIALSVFAGVFLARLAYFLSGNNLAYLLTLVFYSINWFISPFDYQTIAESFSVSAGIFALYYLMLYTKNESFKPLLISGFFLAWMIFLRPFLGLSIVVFGLFVLISKKPFLKSIRYAFILVLPFLVFEGAWITRNYIVLKSFIPLETPYEVSYGKPYAKSWTSIRKMVNGWGEDAAYFEAESASHWFRFASDKRKIGEVIPDNVYQNVNSYSKDSLLELKNRYLIFKSSSMHIPGDKLDNEIANTAKSYLAEYKKNNPIKYQLNLWKGAKRLIINSGSPYVPLSPFSEMPLVLKIVKLFYTVFYFLIILSGVLMLSIELKKGSGFTRLNFGIIASVVLIFVYYSTIQEARYFIFPYIIFTMYSGMFFGKTFLHFRQYL